MKPLLFLAVLICFSKNLVAQFSGHSNALNIAGSQNTLKAEIPLAEPTVIGSTYLNDNWENAEILLKTTDVIDNVPIRVEIEQANVEISYKGEVKFLNLNAVESINLLDGQTNRKKVIRRANQFVFNNTSLNGIVIVSNSGQGYSIVKNFYIDFLQANYNVAMDVGSRDHRKVKREKIYIAQGSKLILVKGSSKKIANEFGADKEKALNLIQEHKFNLSKETDLISFIELMQR